MFRGSTVACTLSDFFEGCGGNCVDGVARSEVRLDLLLAPSSFKQFFPKPRSNSIVPPSTSEMVKTMLLGEYCMAMSRQGASIDFRVSNSSCHPEYWRLLPGRESRWPASILWTSFTGSPCAGTR